MAEGDFLKPTTLEKIFNGAFGLIVRFGGGLKYNYELEVRGRKSGKVFRTPVNLLEFKGKRFLIGTRGETQWARNARAAGEIVLRKGSERMAFKLRELDNAEKPEILKEFLLRFAKTVQRYYVARSGAAAAEFGQDAVKMPVFELIAP